MRWRIVTLVLSTEVQKYGYYQHTRDTVVSADLARMFSLSLSLSLSQTERLSAPAPALPPAQVPAGTPPAGEPRSALRPRRAWVWRGAAGAAGLAPDRRARGAGACPHALRWLVPGPQALRRRAPACALLAWLRRG